MFLHNLSFAYEGLGQAVVAAAVEVGVGVLWHGLGGLQEVLGGPLEVH